MSVAIDLNCDLGEIESSWFSGRDKKLLQYISSVNISCGAHAGSEKLITETLLAALESKLNIGAHPGFPDKENFGRRRLDMSAAEIKEMCFLQIQFLKQKVENAGGKLHHVKPHGALYNWAAKDVQISIAICEAIIRLDRALILFCPPSSVMAEVAAEMSIKTWAEAFADRSYQDDGSLTPRSDKNALIEDPLKALTQVRTISETGFVFALSGKKISMKADTFCIHGDGEMALKIAEKLLNG